MATMKAELDEAVLKCKICEWDANVMDTNAAAGAITMEISWGDVIDNTGAYPSGITGYDVHIDWDGRRPTTQMGYRPASPSTCCDPKKYMMTSTMSPPSGYQDTGKVFITPRTANGDLPPIAVSAPIADNKPGATGTTSATFRQMLSLMALITVIGAQVM